jgi:hypothetical protein
MKLLSFSDAQMAAIHQAAQPLDKFIREAFIASLGQLFAGRDEVGDGEPHRATAELQREYLDPPRTMRPPRPEVHLKRPSQLRR